MSSTRIRPEDCRLIVCERRRLDCGSSGEPCKTLDDTSTCQTNHNTTKRTKRERKKVRYLEDVYNSVPIRSKDEIEKIENQIKDSHDGGD